MTHNCIAYLQILQISVSIILLNMFLWKRKSDTARFVSVTLLKCFLKVSFTLDLIL